MPLRWIEEQEARRVLASAHYELIAVPIAPKASWGKWARRWVAAEPVDPGSEGVPVAEAAADTRRS